MRFKRLLSMAAAPGYVLKNKRTTLERAEKFISDKYFVDCNLYGKLYSARAPVKQLLHYAAPGRIPYAQALKGKYIPAAVGQAFGPTWSTHWFRVDIEVPEEWVGQEVRLLWDSDAECLVWRNGKPVQGLTSEQRRTEYVLSKKLTKKEASQRLYVELAANELFGAGEGYQIAPPRLDRTFSIAAAQVVLRDTWVYQLLMDFQVMVGLAKHLTDENRSYQILYALNEMVNVCEPGNPDTYQRARGIAACELAKHNGGTQHTVRAIGNCHIDSAWLWPYAETIRKCARSFSSSIRLLEDYPNYTFVCSQAQQFEWMKDHYPDLYLEIKHWVKEGRFIPVGGTWVEMDGNIPSGEGFVRQFLYGQKFFEKEFGIRCKEFWLPDTFGYSAQLPQIMKISGISRFVTQKLSWSLVNKFPHHTFWWAGIDGSKVLAHFPPGDSYTLDATVEEVVRTSTNFKDKGRSNESLFLYGHGDGGQGPTQDMVERLTRLQDTDGLPCVDMSTPDKFFTSVEDSDADKLCCWSGELYLELHNGTYTTQAQTKAQNRRTELLLRDVEAVASLALATRVGATYPAAGLLRLWKLVLLNQFHDVLPGSSIEEVYKDALEYYRDVVKTGGELLTEATTSLLTSKNSGSSRVLVNTLSWPRREVVTLAQTPQQQQQAGDGSARPTAFTPPPRKRSKQATPTQHTQLDRHGNTLALVEVPSLGYSVYSSPIPPSMPVQIHKQASGNILMSNEHVEAEVDPCGRLTLLRTRGGTKNGIVAGEFGNQLVMFDDVPLYWDAWDVMDYHLETRKPVTEVVEAASIVEEGPLLVCIKVVLKISAVSQLTQYISLDTGSPYVRFSTTVEWHESHKFLKVEFPLDVHSQYTTYETQYGHLQRPNHFNTSWDWARFEVCGHKWASLAEYDWGVAVLNDSKYGWSCINNILRLSLLRSSKAPDANADMGTQSFTYAVMPHTGSFQEAGVIQAAYEVNVPLHTGRGDLSLPASLPASQSYVQVNTNAVILEALKKAEDDDRALVLRLYEAFGSRTRAKVSLHLSINAKHAKLVNAMEDDLELGPLDLVDNCFMLTFTPFQVVTVMLTLN